MIVGRVNPNQTLEDNGISNTAKVFYNLRNHDLITEAIKRDEGVLGNGGSFLVYFVQDLYGGSDPAHKLNVRMITELAWHSLFIRTMLRRPETKELDSFIPEFTVINCPSFNSNPSKHGCRSDVVIAISFEQKTILIAGTEYAGENKKSIFSILNYLLPEKNIMPKRIRF